MVNHHTGAQNHSYTNPPQELDLYLTEFPEFQNSNQTKLPNKKHLIYMLYLEIFSNKDVYKRYRDFSDPDISF